MSIMSMSMTMSDNNGAFSTPPMPNVTEPRGLKRKLFAFDPIMTYEDRQELKTDVKRVKRDKPPVLTFANCTLCQTETGVPFMKKHFAECKWEHQLYICEECEERLLNDVHWNDRKCPMCRVPIKARTWTRYWQDIKQDWKEARDELRRDLRASVKEFWTSLTELTVFLGPVIVAIFTYFGMMRAHVAELELDVAVMDSVIVKMITFLFCVQLYRQLPTSSTITITTTGTLGTDD